MSHSVIHPVAVIGLKHYRSGSYSNRTVIVRNSIVLSDLLVLNYNLKQIFSAIRYVGYEVLLRQYQPVFVYQRIEAVKSLYEPEIVIGMSLAVIYPFLASCSNLYRSGAYSKLSVFLCGYVIVTRIYGRFTIRKVKLNRNRICSSVFGITVSVSVIYVNNRGLIRKYRIEEAASQTIVKHGISTVCYFKLLTVMSHSVIHPVAVIGLEHYRSGSYGNRTVIVRNIIVLSYCFISNYNLKQIISALPYVRYGMLMDSNKYVIQYKRIVTVKSLYNPEIVIGMSLAVIFPRLASRSYLYRSGAYGKLSVLLNSYIIVLAIYKLTRGSNIKLDCNFISSSVFGITVSVSVIYIHNRCLICK